MKPLLICAPFLLLTLTGSSAVGVADNLPGQDAYEQQVLPLLRKYCADCHAGDAPEGGWAFDAYRQYADVVADRKTWGKAQQLVSSHVMPPVNNVKPSLAERRTILGWIDEGAFYVDAERPDPGRTTLRRLNRAEYDNTVRDVFGIDLRLADQFPPDDSGYGFDNIGDVLSLSPLHLEKYLDAARRVADEATRLDAPPRVGMELTGEKFAVFAGRPELNGTTLMLRPGSDEAGAVVRIPAAGRYRIVVRAAAAARPMRIELRGNDQLLAGFDLPRRGEKAPRAPGTMFVLAELPEGEHRIRLRVTAGELDAEQAPSTRPETGASISFLGIAGPFAPAPPAASPYLRRAFGARPLGTPILKLSGEDLEGGEGRTGLDTGRAWFASRGFRRTPLFLHQAGMYRFRFKVGAQQVGDEPVQFEIRVADRTVGPLRVTARAQVEQWVEAESELPAGQHDLQAWFVNPYQDRQSGAERWFWLHEFSIEGPLGGPYGPAPDDAVRLLLQTGRRAFRRPLQSDESDKLTRLVDAVLVDGETPLEAVHAGVKAILVSPKFLFHPRPQPAGGQQHDTAWIDEFTLASRLSYFLWSSTPDDELLGLAERKQLREQLAAQVRRMIRDPRSEALTQNFAGQWLQLRDLDRASPDRSAFPEFDERLAADMRRESELLFEHILRENRPATEFLTADYTFLSARLAAHYGLPAPEGGGFHRVSLQGSPRGGVVTQGSILTLTSHPTRTSPVKRGKWLLEQLLGTPPPPAPGDVPPLEDGREDASQPLRARLEAHRANAACASCHAFLDPMGFALEQFDAVGRWRTTDEGHSVDASGQLVTGEKFSGWGELRELLVRERKDEFLRCLSESLLTYALGRGMNYRDKFAVRSVVQQGADSGHGFADMVLAVCESVPFQRMRIE
jgi:hypothetical protein